MSYGIDNYRALSPNFHQIFTEDINSVSCKISLQYTEEYSQLFTCFSFNSQWKVLSKNQSKNSNHY